MSHADSAWGWGEPGHEIINRAAAQLMKSSAAAFFQANSDNLATLATTPDIEWKKSATYAKESMLHFFQWDAFSQSSIANSFPIDLNTAVKKVGQKFLDTNGSAVWRATQFYDLLVQALSKDDCVAALQWAGVMGHYLGDLSQPMHNTSDYDGQSIDDRGIHKYFETTLVKKQNQTDLLAAVTAAGAKAHPEVEPSSLTGDDKDVIEIGVLESQASYAVLSELLADFPDKTPNDPDLVDHFAPLMGRGAYVVARIWDLAAERATSKKSCAAKAIKVAQPAWIALTE
jgi:hypothetical protein